MGKWELSTEPDPIHERLARRRAPRRYRILDLEKELRTRGTNRPVQPRCLGIPSQTLADAARLLEAVSSVSTLARVRGIDSSGRYSIPKTIRYTGWDLDDEQYFAALAAMLYPILAIDIARRWSMQVGQLVSMVDSARVPQSSDFYRCLASSEATPRKLKSLFNLPGASNFLELGIQITKSKFTRAGGKHLDYFAPKHGASIKFDFFSSRQKHHRREKQLPLGRVLSTSERQTRLLARLFGRSETAANPEALENARLIAAMKGRFGLHDNNGWREFAERKYAALIKGTAGRPPETPQSAFRRVTMLLYEYFRAFTVSTPYNIEDVRTDNYLQKTFPSALTQQILHDCGVYALRVAYILSSLNTTHSLGLNFHFVSLPNHVSLAITGPKFPVYIWHNNVVSIFNKLPKTSIPLTRVVGLLAAATYIPGPVLTPYRVFDATQSGDTSAQKKHLWATYKTHVVGSRLFGAGISRRRNPAFGADQRYLQFMRRYARISNRSAYMFWRVHGRRLWAEHEAPIVNAAKSLARAYQQPSAPTTAARRQLDTRYLKVVAPYVRGLRQYIAQIESSFADLEAEMREFNKRLDRSRNWRNRKAHEAQLAGTVLRPSVQATGSEPLHLQTWVHTIEEHITRIEGLPVRLSTPGSGATPVVESLKPPFIRTPRRVVYLPED